MVLPEIASLEADAALALHNPVTATVVGERVKVLRIESQGNERRGLVARVERRGVSHVVSLADLVVAEDSPLHAIITRYRVLLGVDDGPRPTEPTSIAELSAGANLEVAVLAVKKTAVRCRLLEGGSTFTLRSPTIWDLVPGEIATVRVKKTWRHAGHPYASGDIIGSRLEVERLGLVPLRLEPHGDWNPAEEYWGEEDDVVPEWAREIVARGPRPEFEMEQVIPGADPTNWDTDPITEAAELREAGDPAGTRALLMEQLAGDLRCLDAHAHLGNLEFDSSPKHAIRHYEAGVRIGELSLGPAFDGVLPWGLIDNRPFLRCLHGHGLCLWRLGQTSAARAVFERMLWLNPSDNQGVRFLLEDIRAGLTWDEMEEREEAANRASKRGRASPELREISVDLAELAFAIEDRDPHHSWYVDRETGAVHLVTEDLPDDDLPVPRERIEDADRFVPVVPEETERAYRDMEEFAATVKDRELENRLSDALAGKGAFSRFNRILSGDRVERERWFAFRRVRLEKRARAWLESKRLRPRAR